MPRKTSPYRVNPGAAFRIADVDPRGRRTSPGGKEEAKDELDSLNERLETLQELLYAEGRRRVLVVLQGMDTSGKDGTIRHVFEGVSPLGVKVASFKKPTIEELAHDFLWRVHRHVPGDGEIVIFNRSHYEDVLVVRVHSYVAEEVWRKRYQQINDFERMLAESGTTILKFFLHISRDEQRERLQSRVDDPEKRWKFNHGDLDERKLWNEYMAAYEEAIARTSTEWAPWFVIPSDSKWYRNLVISRIIVDTLESLDMSWPAAPEGLESLRVD